MFLSHQAHLWQISLKPTKVKTNRLSKVCLQKVFELNSMLFDIEAKEKEKILKSCVALCSEHLDKFITSATAYFRNLLKDASVSIKSKSEAAQTLHRIFQDDLFSLHFQL